MEREEDIQAALDEARTYKEAPTIIEFMIAPDEIVLPMVKSDEVIQIIKICSYFLLFCFRWEIHFVLKHIAQFQNPVSSSSSW